MSKVLNDLVANWAETENLTSIADELEGIDGLYPVASSNLAAVGYNRDKFELFIAFLDGSMYKYSGVPYDEYAGLMRADSHGEYFYDNIRMVYGFERIAG